MAQGKNNAAIAEALTLTTRAVERHTSTPSSPSSRSASSQMSIAA
jgi:hypothetical protein